MRYIIPMLLSLLLLACTSTNTKKEYKAESKPKGQTQIDSLKTETKDSISEEKVIQFYDSLANTDYYKDSMRPYYKALLSEAVERLLEGDSLSPQCVDSLIPTTYSEFLVYISYYIDTQTRKAIDTLDRLQFKYVDKRLIDNEKIFYEYRFFNEILFGEYTKKYFKFDYNDLLEKEAFGWYEGFEYSFYVDREIKEKFCNFCKKLKGKEMYFYYDLYDNYCKKSQDNN